MKSINPANMALFIKPNVLEQKDVLSISACAIFSLNRQNRQLIGSHEFMKFLDGNLAEGEVFDLGVPKPRAEFLVYGSCYTVKPVKGLGVSVSVGDMTKKLVVIGNRQWGYLGAGEAEEFTSMPINYEHAFGGEGYSYNPVGKGYADSKQLPNVEDPKHPIVNKSDCPQPVSFNAYALTWPQRMKFVAKIDDNYLQESWPHLPKGTNPEYFNTAPFDQRLDGFFRGDEKIIINNMHPDKSTQNSQLPGLRARVFVVQKVSADQEVFKEVISRPETLWLFPNQDAGILLYRANIEVADEEFSDISKLYAVWENLSEPPQSLEFYLAQLLKETEPAPQEVAQAAQPPKAEEKKEELKADEAVPSMAAEAAPEFKPEIDPAMVEAKKELEKAKDYFDGILKKANTDAETVLKKLDAKSPNPADTAVDLEKLNKQFEAQAADLMKKNNLSAADVDKLLAKSIPPELSIDDFLLKYSNSNLPIGDFVDKLKNFKETLAEKIAKDQKDAAAAAEKAETAPPPPEEEDLQVEEPVLSAKQLTVAEVLEKYKADKNLSQLDLSGLDFSGCDFSSADFTKSILDKAIFKDAKLDQAVFDHTHLNDADFSNASLLSVKFSNVHARKAKFCQANLSSSAIANSDFSECDFNACILDKAILTESVFEKSSFNLSRAVEISAINNLFAYCDLSNADFARANLTKADLSNAVINQTNFSDCYAPELKLNGVTGTSPCFQNGYLTRSRADKRTLLNNANFKSAQMEFAAWEGAQLPEANLTAALLDHANFSNCLFNKATLELVIAKNTNFSKSQFIAADLNRINLFKGSMRRASLGRANLRYSNLYGVDFFKAKLGDTNFEGANLKRTLLSSLGVELESTY